MLNIEDKRFRGMKFHLGPSWAYRNGNVSPLNR